MSTTTTQNEFHSMRGHVADGTTIKMNNGDVLTLRSVINGWQLFNGDKPHLVSTNSAHVIECAVFSYPEDVGP